jgi:hypothetical protein
MAKTTETKTEEVTKVTIVPNENLTEEQKKAQAESQSPEATENRNASYTMPVEGVNQNEKEK